MPVEHSINERERVLAIQGSGAVTMDELVDSLSSAVISVASGTVPVDYGVLLNINALSHQLSPEHADLITQYVNFLSRCLLGPIAIVGAADKVIPATMIALNAYNEKGTVQMFKSEAEAQHWMTICRP